MNGKHFIGISESSSEVTAALARRILTDEVPDRMRAPLAVQVRKIERALQAFLVGERITRLYAPESAIFPYPQFVFENRQEESNAA
jgi:hypothetical protein